MRERVLGGGADRGHRPTYEPSESRRCTALPDCAGGSELDRAPPGRRRPSRLSTILTELYGYTASEQPRSRPKYRRDDLLEQHERDVDAPGAASGAANAGHRSSTGSRPTRRMHSARFCAYSGIPRSMTPAKKLNTRTRFMPGVDSLESSSPRGFDAKYTTAGSATTVRDCSILEQYGSAKQPNYSVGSNGRRTPIRNDPPH